MTHKKNGTLHMVIVTKDNGEKLRLQFDSVETASSVWTLLCSKGYDVDPQEFGTTIYRNVDSAMECVEDFCGKRES